MQVGVTHLDYNMVLPEFTDILACQYTCWLTTTTIPSATNTATLVELKLGDERRGFPFFRTHKRVDRRQAVCSIG